MGRARPHHTPALYNTQDDGGLFHPGGHRAFAPWMTSAKPCPCTCQGTPAPDAPMPKLHATSPDAKGGR